MRKAPSTFTAAVMLAVFLCFGNAQIFAQCTICVSAVDQTCSGDFEDCGSSLAGCTQSSVFQVGCNGYYTLSARVYSCINSCNCNSCVIVEKVGSSSLVDSVSSNCSNQFCDGQKSVYLYSAYSYRLHVCKRPCDEGLDCEDCDSNCKAEGTLSYGVLSCP